MTDRFDGMADDRHRDEIGQIDLLAYVDGRLDADPRRKQEVERYLSSNPGMAEMVEDMQAQNDALAAVERDWLSAPVPERLLDVVFAGERRSRAVLPLKAAAVLLALTGAAAGGWILGTSGTKDDGLPAFAAQALTDYSHGQPSVAADQSATAMQAATPLSWLTRRISVRVRVPDLTPFGYSLLAHERVDLVDEQAVRLSYRHHDGGRVNIYLRPRWEDGPASPSHRTDAEGGTALYWLDGPLAVAMTAEGGQANVVQSLVPAVRKAIEEVSVAGSRGEPALSHDALLVDPSATEPQGNAPQRQTN